MVVCIVGFCGRCGGWYDRCRLVKVLDRFDAGSIYGMGASLTALFPFLVVFNTHCDRVFWLSRIRSRVPIAEPKYALRSDWGTRFFSFRNRRTHTHAHPQLAQVFASNSIRIHMLQGTGRHAFSSLSGRPWRFWRVSGTIRSPWSIKHPFAGFARGSTCGTEQKETVMIRIQW